MNEKFDMYIRFIIVLLIVFNNVSAVKVAENKYSHNHPMFTIVSDNSKGITREIHHLLTFLEKLNNYENVLALKFNNISNISEVRNLDSKHHFYLTDVVCFKGESCTGKEKKNDYSLPKELIKSEFEKSISSIPPYLLHRFELNIVFF
jgi:hypothetical protein